MSDLLAVGTRFNGADMEFYEKGGGATLFAFRAAGLATGPIVGSQADTLTAHSGGGQTSALALTAGMNRVTTVAAAADSVKLPVSVAGMQIIVINAAATNAMNVYPQTGEIINALSANTALSIVAGKTASFYCVTAGQWHVNLSA